MKRFLITLLLLSCVTVWAQDVVRDSVPPAVADTSDDGENVIGGRVPPVKLQKEANIIGAPIYYNQDGSVRTPMHRGNPRGPYQMPRHHYQNNLDNRFCSFFLEGEGLVATDDLALGVNFSYLPSRWGVYCSFLKGINYNYLSVGPMLRLGDVDNVFDWHLYGGLMFSGGIGGEVGMRMALPQRNSEFCMTSASIGLGRVESTTMFTMGLSIDLIAVTGLSWLLLLW